MEATKEPAGGAPFYDHKEMGIDPSAALEEALAEAVTRKQGDAWREENREAIDAYNQLITEHGVFSRGLRSF